MDQTPRWLREGARDAREPSSTVLGFGRLAHGLAVATAASITMGCVKHLPPTPPPAAVAPAIPAGTPLVPGHGRLIVDVAGGPAPVHRVAMTGTPTQDESGRTRYRFTEAPSLICSASPCVLDVPAGNTLIGFPVVGKSALETELVHVATDTSVYRRSLSVYAGQRSGLTTIGILATSIGGASAITGAALLPIGLAKDNDTMTLAGGITLGAGAALLALGIWAIRHDAPTYRPGSSTHFPLGGAMP